MLRTKTKTDSNHAMSSEALAAWLLWSGESMSELDRSHRNKETINGTLFQRAFDKALKEVWRKGPGPLSDACRERNPKEKVSTSTIHKYVRDGLPKSTPKLVILCEVMGIEVGPLFDGKVVKSKPPKSKSSRLAELTKRIEGTDKEALAIQFMDTLLASRS